MKNVLQGIGFLVLSFAIGEVIKKALTSGGGRSLLGRVGHPELATLEGASEASKKVKQGASLVRSLTREPKVVAPRELMPTGPHWVRVAADAAEMLLATGALLKALSAFVREDERLQQRFGRLGARVG